MSAIAIIPARGGSKRIPRKNIRNFLGKPIITYAIRAAFQSNLFDEVMVSTDDDEIRDISLQSGATVPFRRSALNSNDDATTADVVLEVIEKYRQQGRGFDHACIIYPTAALVDRNKIDDGLKVLTNGNFTSVVPVVKFSFPIWRSFRIEEGRAVMNWPEYSSTRSQDLDPAYHDAGQFYWINVGEFLKDPKLFNNRTGIIELDERFVQDIDNLTDWKMAEMKAHFFSVE